MTTCLNRMDIPLSRTEVLRKINGVEKYITEHNENLPATLYNALEGIGQTYLTYKNKNGTSGWAKQVTVPDGTERIWSDEQAELLETMVNQHMTMQQKGGDPSRSEGPPALQITADSSLIDEPMTEVFSIDAIVQNIRDYIGQLDLKNRELASIVGPVAIVKSMSDNYTKDIPVKIPMLTPFPPFINSVDLNIPPRLLVPMIHSILETCRLMISNTMVDIAFLRKIFSFVLAIFDVTRGEWKDGVLSFMGYFGQDYMMIGQSLKTTRWIYNFISPDIRLNLENDMIAGGKSMIAGAILWLASIVSPSSVQMQINLMLETAKKPIDELNKKFQEVQKDAQKSAYEIGATVIFPKFPLEQFPSFDDIQNFQSLIHRPEIFCSSEFQDILAPAMEVPVLRFILELMNVPTLPEKIREMCKDHEKTIVESLEKQMEPTVILSKESKTDAKIKQKGGKSGKSMKTKKKSKKSEKSRTSTQKRKK